MKWDPIGGAGDLQITWSRSESDRVEVLLDESFTESSVLKQSRHMTVALDHNNSIVLQGRAQFNVIEITSTGGHLTVSDDSSNATFQYILNTENTSVVLANLGLLIEMDNGQLVLPVKWNPAAGAEDITVRWGGNGIEESATLTPELLARLE